VTTLKIDSSDRRFVTSGFDGRWLIWADELPDELCEGLEVTAIQVGNLDGERVLFNRLATFGSTAINYQAADGRRISILRD
jgi:hypothetical protein